MPIRVELVDDVAEARTMVRTALRFRGVFSVVGEATNGAEAIELAGRLSPDIVVLDIGLPDIAGEEVLTQLREVSPATKVVVFSGSEPSENRSLVDGADGYAVKGAQLDYLVELLETLGREHVGSVRTNLEFSFASSAVARQFTREALESWQLHPLVDDALVVVSEMVNNAILHASTGCELALSVNALALRIEVADLGGGTPDPLPPSDTRTHGRGLHLVDAIAAAWGVQPRPGGGKVVWAELLRESGDPNDEFA